MPIRPTDREEEYFARLELERRQQAEAERAAEARRASAAPTTGRAPLSCPRCAADLEEIDYREVRIDRCRACGGVWLDGGELEAITGQERGLGARLRALFGGAPDTPTH